MHYYYSQLHELRHYDLSSICSKHMQQAKAASKQAITLALTLTNVFLTFARTRVSYSQSCSDTKPVTPRLRGPERPVYQPIDQVFWHTALLDIELNNIL